MPKFSEFKNLQSFSVLKINVLLGFVFANQYTLTIMTNDDYSLN
jgi:hypothetical protein